MCDVFIRKASYDYDTLKPTIYRMLEKLDAGTIPMGAHVLIKPNLLIPAVPDKGIVSHPVVVKAVAEYLLEKNCRVQISDSPAMGSFKKVISEGEYEAHLDGLDVAISPFEVSAKKDIGTPFHDIELAKDAVEADFIVNIAKLKTHSQMLMTLGVKNMFGCVIGMKKPEWHLRAGVDRDLFAQLLVRIYMAIRPEITLIDGILGLEGQGPGKSGVPRKLGYLFAGRDAVAADMVICRALGIKPDLLPTHKAARSLGLFTENVSIDGNIPQISNYKLPDLGKLTFGPDRLQGFMRRHMLQRPVVDPHLCKYCGECWKYCPATAISEGRDKIEFDYTACIRCYCCIEVCPHGALRATETIPGRILRRLPMLGL